MSQGSRRSRRPNGRPTEAPHRAAHSSDPRVSGARRRRRQRGRLARQARQRGRLARQARQRGRLARQAGTTTAGSPEQAPQPLGGAGYGSADGWARRARHHRGWVRLRQRGRLSHQARHHHR
ncbi:hypothetical protein [Streptomyces sp. P17]|uniref:hypothetical protein n=1 Tax=Streptomyces sp. P17 TaxID=3074716 RepID=UPI0028F3E3FE|nr:hypothetical protein [Streptomyces sp. P17]MDT9701193.1 hypothetical protein [Streptomyces sp. P17]